MSIELGDEDQYPCTEFFARISKNNGLYSPDPTWFRSMVKAIAHSLNKSLFGRAMECLHECNVSQQAGFLMEFVRVIF